MARSRSSRSGPLRWCSNAMIPLDVTHQLHFDPSDLGDLAHLGDFGRLASKACSHFHAQGFEAVPHDAIAAIALLNPELFDWEERWVRCELTGTLTRGATVVDRRPRGERGSVRVAMGVDVSAVKERIFEAIGALGETARSKVPQFAGSVALFGHHGPFIRNQGSSLSRVATLSISANLSRARSLGSQAAPLPPTCSRAAATNLHAPHCSEASRSQYRRIAAPAGSCATRAAAVANGGESSDPCDDSRATSNSCTTSGTG